MATLLDQLGELASWNSFAASLVAQAKRKPLSSAQVGAAERMLAKLAANAVNREPVAADLSRCHDMFASALGDGMKAPQFRFLWGADEVALSLAKATSRNAGSLYVKLNGEYAGKLSAGVYHPFDMLPQDAADLAARLLEVARDPAAAAYAYGHETSRCACCGKLLTDDKRTGADGLTAVVRGVGATCAKRWGIL
jgi:hypothetical protein